MAEFARATSTKTLGSTTEFMTCVTPTVRCVMFAETNNRKKKIYQRKIIIILDNQKAIISYNRTESPAYWNIYQIEGIEQNATSKNE